LRRPIRKNKENGDIKIHRVSSSSSLEVPDKCMQEREKCMSPLRGSTGMGMEEATSNRPASPMKHTSGIERGVYSIFHIQALGRAAVVLYVMEWNLY
jgi:hypothetical protein